MQIQDGRKGHLATLPLVDSGMSIRDVGQKMREFRIGAAAIARPNRTFTIVTEEEISHVGVRGHAGARVGDVFRDHENVEFADIGAVARIAHGLWEVRGIRQDCRIVAVGHNNVKIFGPSVDYWQRLHR